MIETESGSLYKVDLDAMTLTRLPNGGGQDMRKDGEAVPLLFVDELVVGRGAIFVIAGLVDGDNIVTQRYTSNIVSIEVVEND